MYADDLVLLAQNERDVQKMLNTVGEWCPKLGMNVKPFKFRRYTCQKQIQVLYKCCLQKRRSAFKHFTMQYKYLGLVLNQLFDFNDPAEQVAKAAGRALHVLIAKSKMYWGMPFICFRKLFQSVVLPVIQYVSQIQVKKQYTCINALQNRACRYYLGVGKYTVNAAVQ